MFIVFSGKHSFADVRECNLTKKINKNRGCLPECKKVFFVIFLVLVVLFFCFSMFLCFCFVHNSPKWLFSCIFRGFLSILFPQKACLKLFPFFLFYFAFVFSFKIHFFFAFCPSTNPFLENISLWGFFCFSFACLFLS